MSTCLIKNMNYYAPFQWRRRGGILIRVLPNGPLSRMAPPPLILATMQNAFDYYLHTVAEIDNDHPPTILPSNNKQPPPPPRKDSTYAAPNATFVSPVVNPIIIFGIILSHMPIEHYCPSSTSHICPMILSFSVQSVIWIVNVWLSDGWRIWNMNYEWMTWEGRVKKMMILG